MSVTAPKGFVAAGTRAGIKPAEAAAHNKPLDLAIVATADNTPATAAAVFTQNKARAAPVVVSKQHLDATNGRATAVVLNSGNANAATGAHGYDTAERTCIAAAKELGCDPTEVLVCSTGLIGIPLDPALLERAIPGLASAASSAGGGDAAEAIMTTDTYAKQVTVVGPQERFVVGGMAKGAAMLAPNMATMLAVLTTDADVDQPTLQRALTHAIEHSFNRLTVDGCTSTNDTVIVLASGAAGPPADAADLVAALTEACTDLAEQMAGDAEGATKVVRVTVTGAVDNAQAATAARNIAESQLTKCSWYGCDPYWGRVASDVGSAPGVNLDMDRLTIAYGGVTVARNGTAMQLTPDDEARLQAHMAGRHLGVTVDLGLGDGTWWLLTNDLTHAYVDENMGTS